MSLAAERAGRTALWSAAFFGEDECAALILEADAAVDLPNTNGWTPLCVACQGGHLETVKLLIKAGAQLKDQLNKLKAGSSGETIAKVEDALSKATSKFNELDKEYDLVEKGKQALGYAGDLSAKAIDKGLELNAEYKLTDQVVAKVTEASSAAAAKATKKSA